jgi:ABC-type branched-subunit amino acid transport system substrate-binding protein
MPEDTRLYGRDEALTLVRGFLEREERDGRPGSRITPVIVFGAPPGAGKTALLAELARVLDQNAPSVRIDCARLRGEATELPIQLAFELNRRCGRYRSLPFPRLIAARIAMKVPLGNLTCEADREEARALIRGALEKNRNTAAVLQKAVSGMLDAVIPPLDGTPPTTGRVVLEIFRKAAPRLVLGGMFATRRGRRIVLGEGQDWYGRQGRNPLDVLVDLNRQAAAAPDSEPDQVEVASALWSAFLADLEAAFGKRQAVNWTFNCLVLLDNADELPGKVLEQLVATCAGANPLTVVAASRGLLAERAAPQQADFTPLATASYAHWHAEGARRCYLVELPDLTAADVSAMVNRLEGLPVGARRGAIATAIHHYTCGHAAAVRSLVDAVAVAPEVAEPDSEETFDLARLLDLPVAGTTLADGLLDLLLSGIPVRTAEDLVTCSAARNLAEAQLLGEKSDLVRRKRTANSGFFSPAFWWPARGEQMPHPLLRRLMLRRLAARAAYQTASWAAVHAWLRANSDETGALYHTLALGEVLQVGRQLADVVADTDAEGWLRLLAGAAAAPNNLDQRLKSTRGVDELTGQAGPDDDVAVTMARLAAAMWIDADPLADQDRSDLRNDIRDGLHQLAQSVFRGPALIAFARKADRENATRGPALPPGSGPAGEAPPMLWVPPLSRRGARRARGRKVIAAVSAAVVVAGVAAGSYALASASGGPASCAPAEGPFRVFLDEGECVGVTSSYVFDPASPAIVAVQGLIAAQDAWVTSSYPHDYVTVALLTPLTEPASDTATPSDVTLARITDELRGAYLAQYYANHDTGMLPKVRLVLANEGSGEQGWQADWDQLRQLKTAPGQLVAVTGMGLSVQQTIDAAHTIGGAGVPMFGAVTTADGLDSSTSSNLAQVVPNVSDEVQALAQFLRKPSRSVLVYDSQATDLYTSSLGKDLLRTFGSSIIGPAIQYAPSGFDSTLFKKIAEELCYTPRQPPLVFYAGRDSVFGDFITQLQQEVDCVGQRLTIVTGGDGDGVQPSATLPDTGGAQVSIIYADIEDGAKITPAFRQEYQQLLGKGNDQDLADPWMLATYNATTAATSAIAQQAGSMPPADQPALTASEVGIWVDQLNGPDVVAGATGAFQIGATGDLENPEIPIIELANGKATTLATETVP